MGIQLKTRTCPVCGSSDTSHIFVEANFDLSRLDSFGFASRKLPEYMHYRLLTCPVCDLVYASPAPTADELAKVYREAAFDSGEESGYASLTYARFLAEMIKRLPDQQGALDIGAGDGAFLQRLLEAGFSDVVGVEPSAAPIAAAQATVKPLIRHNVFRATDFAAGSFSLITCFQTLEHIEDPLGLCRDAYQLLKSGGAVFCIAHNYRALQAKLLRTKSPIFDIEHLQLFSPRSAQELLRRAGFGRIKVRPVINRYPLHYWVKLFPLPTGLKRRLLPQLKQSRIGQTLVTLSAGNIALIGYKTNA